MWENRDIKTAILTAVLLVLVLLSGIMVIQQHVSAETDNIITGAEELEAAEVEEVDLTQTDLEEVDLDAAEPTEESATRQLTVYQREITYPEYLAQYPELVRPNKEIYIAADSYRNATTEVTVLEDYAGMSGNSILTGERGYVGWEVEVEEAGFYNLEITYYPVTGRSSSIKRDILINGKRPFSEAGYLTLHRVWGDGGSIEIDINGNHLRPQQVEKPIWQSVALWDPLGYEQEPFLFYFEKGTNILELQSVSEGMIINSLRLFQAKEVLDYKQVTEEYQRLGYKPAKDVFYLLEGEAAAYRSAPTIIPEHDMGDPTVQPYHEVQIRLNSIGGHRWKYVGDWATWEFEVPMSGLYQIAIKGKQDQRRGVYSNRKLLIDGEVPFAEFKAMRFPYDTSYNMITPQTEDGETALVYLEAGKHQLTLEVVLGDVADILRRVEDTLYDLNTIFRRIIMITSGQPDPLRSYELDKKIPGLIDALMEQAAILRDISYEFELFTGQKGGHTALLNTFARMLEDMADRPYAIPSLIQEFRDNVGALGTWMNQTIEQPLQVDYIIVASPDKVLPSPKPTAVQTLTHEIKSFLASFTYDYSRVGDRGLIERDEALKVWIGSGRDQAQVLKQMIEDSFTPMTGITVDLELIQSMDQLLIPSIIAKTAPDAALGAANMDLAFRNALADLTMFDDFDEVSQRFMKSAFLPFRFRGGVYGLPEVQGFPMLFYRKDILQEFGLEVPQTWDDVIAIIPELQKENMEFGLWPNMGTYQMFLYQRGVALFKEDVIATNLDSEVAIQVFDELTNLYTLFNLLIQFDEANRFRMGEMPLLVANYGLYNTLSVFAPELRGEWGMTLVPGTLMPDGTINRTVPVGGTVVAPGAVAVPQGTSGAVILEGSKRKEQAWEFLKWWTSKDTQVRFGREMESLMGAAARYATANVEAFAELPWNAEERDALMEQWEWVEGIPAVLGGYYVNRLFDWLFRAVVIGNEPLRESILEYDRQINEEIARKREEFGLETSIDRLSQEQIDLYWSHYTRVHRLD